MYASYQVIHQYETENGVSPTGLYFNKLMSLLHRDLRNRGHDLKLPHCWYQYGDEVVRSWMPEQIVWSHDAVDRTVVSWAGPKPHRQVGKGLESEIHGTVVELGARYKDIEKAVDAVYSYAPFPFQKQFRKARQLYGSGANKIIAAKSPELISKAVVDAFKVFPTKEFPEPANYARLVSAATTAVLDEAPQRLQLVNDLCEKYWNFFCYHLRLHLKGHENVPGEALDIWSQKLAPERANYELDLQLHLTQAMSAVPSLKEQDQFIPWVSASQYTKEQVARILKEAGPAFEGLDKFTKAARRGYGKTFAA